MNSKIASIALLICLFSFGAQASDHAERGCFTRACSRLCDFVGKYGAAVNAIFSAAECTSRLAAQGENDPAMLTKCFALASSAWFIGHVWGEGSFLYFAKEMPKWRPDGRDAQNEKINTSYLAEVCERWPLMSFVNSAGVMVFLWLLNDQAGPPVSLSLLEIGSYGQFIGILVSFSLYVFEMTLREFEKKASKPKLEALIARSREAQRKHKRVMAKPSAEINIDPELFRLLRRTMPLMFGFVGGSSFSLMTAHLRGYHPAMMCKNFVLSAGAGTLGTALGSYGMEQFIRVMLAYFSATYGRGAVFSIDDPRDDECEGAMEALLVKAGKLYASHPFILSFVGLEALAALDPEKTAAASILQPTLFWLSVLGGGFSETAMLKSRLEKIFPEMQSALDRHTAQNSPKTDRRGTKKRFKRFVQSFDRNPEGAPNPKVPPKYVLIRPELVHKEKPAKIKRRKEIAKDKREERQELERQAQEWLRDEEAAFYRRRQQMEDLQKKLSQESQTSEQEQLSEAEKQKRKSRPRGPRRAKREMAQQSDKATEQDLQQDGDNDDEQKFQDYEESEEVKSSEPAINRLSRALIWVLHYKGRDRDDQARHFILSGADVGAKTEVGCPLDVAAEIDLEEGKKGRFSLVYLLQHLAKISGLKAADTGTPIERRDELAFIRIFVLHGFRAFFIQPGLYPSQGLASYFKRLPAFSSEFDDFEMIIDKVFAGAKEWIFVPNSLEKFGRPYFTIQEVIDLIKGI